MSEQHPVPPETDPMSQQAPPIPQAPSVDSVTTNAAGGPGRTVEMSPDHDPALPAPVDAAPAPRHYELPSGRFGFLVYNLLRIGLLLVVGGILFLLGLRSYLLVLVAVVISGMISMVLLSRRRDAAVISLGEVYRRVNDRMDSRTRAEDD